MNRNSKKRMPHRKRQGMTLLELVMVTVIIGILASMAVPSFHRALEQSRADVACANLRAIWSAQRLYWLDNRTYAVDLATLQSLDLLDDSLSNQPYYYYEIGAADATTFTAWATRASNSAWNGSFNITQGGQVNGYLSAYNQDDIVAAY